MKKKPTQEFERITTKYGIEKTKREKHGLFIAYSISNEENNKNNDIKHVSKDRQVKKNSFVKALH